VISGAIIRGSRKGIKIGRSKTKSLLGNSIFSGLKEVRGTLTMAREKAFSLLIPPTCLSSISGINCANWRTVPVFSGKEPQAAVFPSKAREKGAIPTQNTKPHITYTHRNMTKYTRSLIHSIEILMTFYTFVLKNAMRNT
jgi:hypothetical protein